MIFYAAELSAFLPASGAGALTYGWGTSSWGALYSLPQAFATTTTFFYSDVGYRTLSTDPGGVQPYSPLLTEAFAVDRLLNLDLSASNIAASWGSVQVSNADGSLNSIVSNWNNDGRAARVLWGSKTMENFTSFRSSRSTTGTYLDAVGAVQTAPAYTVRFDLSTGSPVLINETAVTNLCPTSNAQTGGTWGGTVTVAQNAVSAPDATTTATRFVCSAVGPGGGLSAKYLSPPVGSYTISVWMRASATISVGLYACWDDSGATQHATLRTTNLTTTWQRFQLPVITTAAGALRVYWQVNLLASQTVYAWGTQIESGSAMTSLIYTTGSAVLRDADKLYNARRIYTDPAYASLSPVFAGVSTPWSLDDVALTVPLRDATYWLERPLQQTQYAGTGTYEGSSGLAGVTKPKTRGVVNNVTPVLVDAANLIYQYSDGPGSLQVLYEGGAANRTFQADTTNLYSGTTTAGLYRTDNSRGLFQLGNTPTGAITCDCTGNFPIAGAQSTLAAIARYLLTEDLQLPSANINTASFTTAAASYAYAGGVHFASGEQIDGVAAVNRVLAGFGAALFPGRDGALRVLALAAPASGATGAASYGTSSMISLTPLALPASLSPPPYRIRIGYQHNYTVQTSGLIGAATSARKQYIAQTDLYGSAISNAIQIAYARPTDPPAIFGSLSNLADATATATRLIALFSARRRLYSVILPIEIGILREIGDLVQITWPMDDLQAGKIGTVIGDAFRSGDGTITLKVLI